MLSSSQLESMEKLDRFMHKIVKGKEKPDESIKFSKFHSTAEEEQTELVIDLQDLLSRVNFENRWLYKGSFTTPPATEGVLFNIIDDIQYVSQSTVDMYRKGKFNHARGDLRCSKCGGN
mmetsp:Transcript_11266/g.18961  ORF Transcript_11266/g.18961 Transcript_11266/m.18961 type:complete len:119 (-) Transcript_11266:197-553(-)